MKININNIQLYYETIGQGPPLILVHGNGEDHTIFDKTVEELKNQFTVYAIDSRGHGKSSRVEEFHYEELTEDIRLFIEKLNLHRPFFCGFSDGGILGLMLAYKYPHLLKKIVVCGANLNPKGMKRIWYVLFNIIYFITRDRKVKVMVKEPNITEEMLRQIVTPTLVLAGEKDMIRDAHTRKIAECIKGSTLNIIKDEHHGSYIVHSEKIGLYLKEYFVKEH